MFAVLAQPYPPFGASRHGVAICLLAGTCVFAVLYLLQPFGMNRLPIATLLLHSAVYGIGTFAISLLFTVALPAWRPAFFAEARWTVGREIIFLFIMVTAIAVGNLFINNRLTNGLITLAQFLRFMGITMSVGILPLTLAVLFKQRNLYQKYRRAAEALNVQLQQEQLAAKPPAPVAAAAPYSKTLCLTGDNQQEKLELYVQHLLLISTADNYVNICHLHNGVAEAVLFRGTLKKMETALLPYSSFLRCHRSHLVNLERVRRVTGNAQGYKLEVEGLPQAVPVGRNYNDVVKARLLHLQH